MSSLDLYNKSILAIPAYYFLTLVPHAWAIQIASGGNPARWDNRNPRATGLKKTLSERLPPELYQKYERCEAAHANGMENLPLFATAMILGNIAKLPADELSKTAGTYIALRAIYFITYIMTSRKQYTVVRSGLWIGSVVLCIRTIVQAAKAMV